MRHQNGVRVGISAQSKWESKVMPRPSMLNQAPIRPIHIGHTLNNILPKLYNAKYLSLIDVSSGYHNLKVDKKSSYLITFAFQFGRYRDKHLLFGASPVGDMFQRKIDNIFKDLPNVLGIADDIY